MSNRMMRGSLRRTLLIGSALAAMLAGAGIATAQAPVDNPPGATFQTQQNREGLQGIRRTPSQYSRTRHPPEIGNPYRQGKANDRASTSRHTKKHRTH